MRCKSTKGALAPATFIENTEGRSPAPFMIKRPNMVGHRITVIAQSLVFIPNYGCFAVRYLFVK